MISTALTELLGVRVPLLNAPMTPQAGGRLARAVSEAGAFGMIGIEEIDTEAGIAEQLAIVTKGQPVPFGIGLVAWVVERRPELLEMAIAARPTMISISFGDPGPYVARIRDAGILIACQVQSREWAETALAAGVDVLVAQGTEAGGHTGRVGTLPLLQIVLEMTDAPVVAAGGIASGRGLAAVLAAGASGAWIGTPFLLAEEALNSARARTRIVEANETQTLYTSVYDRLQDKSWPDEFAARALRNPFGARWTGHEEMLGDGTEPRAEFERAKAAEDYDVAHIYAGQSIGLLGTVTPAAEIVASIESQAHYLLGAVSGTVGRSASEPGERHRLDA
jgi:nitronate monooxygenase